ncbi:MAG: GMC family oxidoreductase [Alcanivoracaceae bacterium]|nr:GMC family oxidoreductase [Alcanivoracaceae bacterium]
MSKSNKPDNASSMPPRHSTQKARGTAFAFVEAMIPAADIDIHAVCAQVDTWLAPHPIIKASLNSALFWLEARALLSGNRFSALPLEKRKRLLNALAGKPLSGHVLRALAAPYKAAWLFDEELQKQVVGRAPVSAPSQVEVFPWQHQITRAEELEEDQQLEADVVVIGSGAGGAAAAYELASRGLAVLIVEEGNYYTRKDFSGRLQDVVPKLYRAMGATATFGNAVIPVPIGRNVGGTTTINSGTCMRTPDAVLDAWRRKGLSAFTKNEMAPWLDGVEEMLGVTQAQERYVGEIGNVIRDGGKQLGLTAMHALRRNAPGCDGQGLCQFGCPTDAKRSTNVSYIPRALERGAFLFTGFRAERVLHTNQTTKGVVLHSVKESGKKVRIHIKTSNVIVAAGALLTPGLLARNGVKNSHLGRHLTLHPCGVVNAIFPDKDFANGSTIPQGFGIADFAEKGLIFEGGTLPFVGHGLSNPFYGDEFVQFCNDYQHTAYFGFMIKDTSEGSVKKGPHRDLPLLRYHLNEEDFAQFKVGIETLAKIFLLAGAKEVIVPGVRQHTRIKSESELTAWLQGNRTPKDFLISAYHPLGSARIAPDEEEGVCDTEHQVFGWQGLYVMDGSSVPSSLGANPQVTIMAMAARAASRLADRIQQ